MSLFSDVSSRVINTPDKEELSSWLPSSDEITKNVAQAVGRFGRLSILSSEVFDDDDTVDNDERNSTK